MKFCTNVFHKLALIQKLKISLSGEDVIDLIMRGIDDDQLKFSVETAGIKEPAVLANHLRTFDTKAWVSKGSGTGI